MKICILSLIVSTIITFDSIAQRKNQSPERYFPSQGDWQQSSPESAGMDGVLLEKAISIARNAESMNPRSMEENHYRTFGREPFGEAIGPMKNRGNQTGIIIRRGKVIASWGEPDRPDMTHSVTKSFLSAVTGLAYDRGLIRSVYDTVANCIPPILNMKDNPENNTEDNRRPALFELFDTPHNRTITWDHLLRQTSDWEGTLWGKPDWADRPSDKPDEWLTRKRYLPGDVFEYNDVRVNVLALAVLNVWRRPLPQVLREHIMEPIGASSTWRWYGYANSWILIDGQSMQSVSGGGHWGGGMIINAWDMARFGYLLLNNGKWNDKQILSSEWMTLSSTPTAANTGYGFMNWYLNTDRKFLPSAPANAVTHVGNGTNIVYIDRENDIVAVIRWIDGKRLDEIIGAILGSIKR